MLIVGYESDISRRLLQFSSFGSLKNLQFPRRKRPAYGCDVVRAGAAVRVPVMNLAMSFFSFLCSEGRM